MASRSAVGWGVVFAVLAAFTIPWFMWRESATVAGLPVWLWWHVGWLCLTAVAFAVFARRDWGTFVEAGLEASDGEADRETAGAEPGPEASVAEGDR